jgi:HAD superfamily phosphatase (TIGR01681 family)
LETVPLVDFLIRYFETQDRTWRDLYIGERIKQVHVSTDNVEQNLARRTRILSGDRDSLGKLLAGELDPSDREQLDVLLSEALRLATASTQEVHALFVGDCLLFHIASFCVTALLEVGITLRPTYEPSKNPFDLRNSIQKLDCGAFDLVSYSPYSYEFSLLMSQTFHMRSLGYSRRKLEDIARDASDQTTLTLGLLADKFACPVAVHCTAHIRAYHDSWRSYAVTVATRPVRQRVADLVNAVLDQQIAEYNQTASRPFLVIDERPVVLKYGERELGKRLYDAIYYHPTVLSAHLAKFYPSLLASAKYLLSKKVIVTDLDNTLWEGLVGEGPVQHQRHRQQVLKRLRQKGIVLAIASKNDQKCIHWYGAVLSEDDFVAMEINWENKALNIQRIAAKLNLDLRDFVFIDDRDEELEIVRRALPQVRVLSANSEWTWQMLEWWVAALPNQGSADRTQLYREREERESYLAARLTADQDQILSFHSARELRI